MHPLVLGLGVPELLIILAVVLLLFGGSRLAGLGKSTGRALKEFKEETKGLKADDGDAPTAARRHPPGRPRSRRPPDPPYQQPPPGPGDPNPPAGEPRRDRLTARVRALPCL